MRIIDFHTHPGYNTTKKFGYDMTDELFVSELKRSGITQACGSAIMADFFTSKKEEFGGILQTLNTYAWNMQEKYPDFFIPGIHIHPNHPEISAEHLRIHKEKGFKLVGELVPYLMDYPGCLTEGCHELFELCDQYGMILNLHEQLDISIEIAKAFPHMPVVVAHPGYNEMYLDRLEALKKYDNLYLDISGTGIAATGMLRYGVETVGAERLLFGTDFPGYNPEMYVRSVLFDNLTDDAREQIFWRNAAGLLGIS